MTWKSKKKKGVVKKTGDKIKAIKPSKRVVAPKVRNSGTMSESAFWSFIRSVLRNKSRFWKPIQECKQLHKRKSQSSNKKLKFEYQCSECKEWFPEKEIDVDHIVPAGSLNKAEDLPQFVEKLFCEVVNLQLLCKKKCHLEKTTKDKELIKLNKLNDGNI